MTRLRRRQRCIEPGEWPERSGRARVLIEHPDGMALWTEAEALREAGYDVAVCKGPSEEAGACPLLAEGRCALADEADLVVTTPSLQDGRRIVAALAERPAALVVEGPRNALALGGYRVDGATVPYPLTTEALVAAVGETLRRRSE
jgi:hypothetical protein